MRVYSADEGEDHRQSPLQAARRPESDQLTHDEPQIEAARVDQDALQDREIVE